MSNSTIPGRPYGMASSQSSIRRYVLLCFRRTIPISLIRWWCAVCCDAVGSVCRVSQCQRWAVVVTYSLTYQQQWSETCCRVRPSHSNLRTEKILWDLLENLIHQTGWLLHCVRYLISIDSSFRLILEWWTSGSATYFLSWCNHVVRCCAIHIFISFLAEISQWTHSKTYWGTKE